MAAYLIVYREGPVRDEAAMAEYQKRTREIPPGDSGLTPLVVYGAVQPLEGRPPEGVIMLQFPTVEAARSWYESPAYQAALPHRLKSADYRTIIVEGL
jgi:uncharacterized protein (DUF1330 family)